MARAPGGKPPPVRERRDPQTEQDFKQQGKARGRNPREGTGRIGSPENPAPVPDWARQRQATGTPRPPLGRPGPHDPEPQGGPVPKKIPRPGPPKPPFSMGRRPKMSARIMNL